MSYVPLHADARWARSSSLVPLLFPCRNSYNHASPKFYHPVLSYVPLHADGCWARSSWPCDPLPHPTDFWPGCQRAECIARRCEPASSQP
eukprot:scaffold155216_cov18-Tisochrysis_lutea.AAC.1